jgi:hypothetical protein
LALLRNPQIAGGYQEGVVHPTEPENDEEAVHQEDDPEMRE